MPKFNPLDYPISFAQPLRIAQSSWVLHVPFAMFIMDLLRPATFVELGTEYGVSYCAFCQAVDALKLDTRCYAVDTWRGDAYTSAYGDEVLDNLRQHHNPLYGRFSRLIQSTFDAALGHFAEGSIDLLHIDGFHTYEAVRHDFETWRPKLSPHGVVIFHDTNVRENNFGVWKLWDELKAKYPNFEMFHGHGLGVLAVGREYPSALDLLIKSSNEAPLIRDFFFQLGSGVEREQTNRVLAAKVTDKEQQIQGLTSQLAEERQSVQAFSSQLAVKESILSEIYRSKAWRLVTRLRRILTYLRSPGRWGFRLLRKLISLPREILRAPEVRRNIALLRSSELFDEAWYLDQNPDVAQAKVDPARHYLLHGGFEGRDPSPLFNSSWYLNTYYDARRAHINPLVHYLKEGLKDKRPASPQMVFKKGTLDRESEPSVEPSPNILRSSAELTEHLNREKKFDKYVISISHDNYLSVNGGVQVAIGNQQRILNQSSVGYLHIYPFKYQQTLTDYDDSFLVGISLDGKDIGIVKIQALLEAIKQADPAKIEDIHIHHTMGMSIKAIEQILAFGHHRGKFWLHDYFSLCPSKHLMRNDVSFCGAPDISSNSCVVCKYGEDRMRQNGEFLSLFKNNELEVIAPSEFTLDFWKEKFPFKQGTGKVFPLAILKEIEKRPARERAGELRIAFLGAPSDHKGWQTWLKIVELFSEKQKYYFFHFSSYPGTSGNYQWIRTTVTKNDPDAMINRLKDKNIDVAILWSITAETYSFTLLEALAAGCFVITNTKSGNIQFYIGNHPNFGIVLVNDNELIELLESNKLEGIIAGYQKGGIPQALLVNNDSRDY